MSSPVEVPRLVHDVAVRCAGVGGRAWLVGGGVRDTLLGRPGHDWDVEVHHVSESDLEAVLRRLGRVDAVGKAFGVFRVTRDGLTVDVSLPRRDSKTGPGHKGITVHGDPHLGLVEATRRRDLTINAILRDVLTGELADPFNGRRDLDTRVLRAVDPDTFLEDPLRALRAAQLAARLDFTPDPALVDLCAGANLSELPRERIRGEWEKLLLKGRRPSRGLRLLRDARQLSALFPRLVDVDDAPLDRVVVDRDAMAPEGRRFALMLLGWLRASPPDDAADTLDRLGVVHHGGFPTRDRTLAALRAWRAPIGDAIARRRLATLAEAGLVVVARRAAGEHVGDALERLAEQGLLDRAEPPLLLGRDLLERGWTAGPKLGADLATAYEAQITEVFRDRAGALAWLETQRPPH